MKRFVVPALLIAALAVGAGANAQAQKPLRTLRIGIGPSTCLAPVFVAKEKGFFAEEGIDAELVNGTFAIAKDQIATSKIQVAMGLIDVWLKPIESGLDIKFAAGIHFGCTQILVRSNSNIHSVKDLKGKRVGVTTFGDGPTVFVSRAMILNHLNPRTDVTWRPYPAELLTHALEKGEVDVVGLGDPLGTLAVRSGKERTLLNQATDAPWSHEYCCLIGFNGKFVRAEPLVAAGAARAILKAAAWVKQHPTEAAQILVSKKYIPSTDVKMNAQLLTEYNYSPSTSGAQRSILHAADQSVRAGILLPGTDPARLTKATFVALPGLQQYP